MQKKIAIAGIKYLKLNLKEIKELYKSSEDNLELIFELLKQKDSLLDLSFFYKLFKKLKLEQYKIWVGKYYMDLETIKIIAERFPESSELISKLLRCQVIQSVEHKEIRNDLFKLLKKDEIIFFLENSFIDESLINIIYNNFKNDSKIMLMLFCRKKVRTDEILAFKILQECNIDEIKELLDKKYFLSTNLLKNIWIRFQDKDIAFQIIQRPNIREDFEFYVEVFNFLKKEDLILFLNPDKNSHLSTHDCYLAHQNFSDDIKVLQTLIKLDLVEKEKILFKMINLKIENIKQQNLS